jgi:hypothetical protein
MLGLMVVAILALAREQFNVGAPGELASISIPFKASRTEVT